MSNILEPSTGRCAILVLGMHRSGTSALAGVLSRLGVALPKTLMQPNSHNQRGYSESVAIAEFHDRLLASAGTSWRDWEPFDQSWFASPFAQSFASQVEQLLADEFGDARLFVLKDPRISRILPFWLAQFDQLGITPKIVLTVRNPLETAASLERRDYFSPRIAFLLWLRYLLDAERASRGLPRCWVHYEDLLSDWRSAVGNLGSALDLSWPIPVGDAEADIDAFLTPSLQHHEVQPGQLDMRGDVLPWVKTAYGAVSDRVALRDSDTSLQRQLDDLGQNFDTACEIFHPLISAELRRSIAALERLSRGIEKRDESIRNMRARYRFTLIGLASFFRQRIGLLTKPRAPRKPPTGPSAPRVEQNDQNGGSPDPAARQPDPTKAARHDRAYAKYLFRHAGNKRVRLAGPKALLKEGRLQSPGDVPLPLSDRLDFEARPRAQIAVVCHVYYLSLWPELESQIAQIPTDFDLFVTITDAPEAAALAAKIMTEHADAEVRIVPNHGRDIFPFISILNSGVLDDYHLVLKLHTKKSPHRRDGDYWRRKLLFGLLGSPENIGDILRGFNRDQKLGLVVADGEIYEGDRGWKRNRPICEQLAKTIGISIDDYPARFAGGSIFWSRSSALWPIRQLGLTAASFEPENGAVDGTMAHAIERLFSILAMAAGFSVEERGRL